MSEASLRGTRRRPVQERSQETVQRILDAASRLLGEIPLEQITTIRIADAAGLSVGAFYRFFPDKQAIIDGIAVRRIEDVRRLARAARCLTCRNSTVPRC